MSGSTHGTAPVVPGLVETGRGSVIVGPQATSNITKHARMTLGCLIGLHESKVSDTFCSMARFDRNQFLLLATAIGAATTTMASKSYPDDVEQDQAGACDGDTGQTGRAKYCPMAEGRRKGCLDSSSCYDMGLKAASELRLFDCLAAAPTNACFVEGAPPARDRCVQQVVSHACADPLAAQVCQRVAQTCGRRSGSLMNSCATYLTPLTTVGRNNFRACMVEGCDDYQFKACTHYMQ